MGLFPAKNQVGLYVDAETITVVNGQSAGTAVRVAGFSELRVQTILEGSPDAKQKALDNIKAALGAAGASGAKSVLITVPGEGSMTRHFELPALPKKEERGAVRFEAQKYVPFEMKDLYYDYETYPADPEKKRNRVVFFACKKQWVNTLSALLTLAGMKIDQVELVSQSIARSFHRHAAKRSDEVSLVIVSNDERTAELVIQKEGSVLTTRHVSIARTADGKSVDVPAFVSDVRISLDYFSENFKDMKLGRVYVVDPFPGETSTLCEALGRELSLPADSGSLFTPPDTPVVSAAAAVAAYGLTLGAVQKIDRKKHRISLKPTEAMTAAPAPVLTWEQEKKQLNDLATKEIIGVVVLIGALFFLIQNITSRTGAQLRNAIASYPQSQSASLAEPLEALQQKETQMTQKMGYYSAVFNQRSYFTLKLNELIKLVPPNVRLTQFSFSDELSPKGTSDVRLSIQGHITAAEPGTELTIVNRFVAQIAANKDFMQGMDEVRIAGTKRTTVNKQPVTQFTIEGSRKR